MYMYIYIHTREAIPITITTTFNITVHFGYGSWRNLHQLVDFQSDALPLGLLRFRKQRQRSCDFPRSLSNPGRASAQGLCKNLASLGLSAYELLSISVI